MTLAGFPHSGTPGSTPTCGSPRLFAACRALLRLSVPRHPPCALVRLTGSSRTPLARRGFNPAHRSFSDLRWCSRLLSTLLLPNFPIPVFSINQVGRVLDQCARLASLCFRQSRRMLTRGSRKEVIQPQVPLRLPCYDFAPVTELAFGGSLPCGLGHRLRALPTPMA
jgi:hypothetical protein